MVKSKWLLGDTPDPLENRVEEYRLEMGKRNPKRLAAVTGSVYSTNETGQESFKFPYWDQEIIINYPQFTGENTITGKSLNTFDLTLMAYYFQGRNSTPLTGKWIAFNELPDGRFYAQAYQGYTGNKLAGIFENDADAFTAAALNIGGTREDFGNIAFSFKVLPYISLLAVCWLGDDEFPPSYRVLFDSAIVNHLTTDACAILGSTLTSKFIKSKGS